MTEGGECESRKLRLEARQAGRAGILAAPELPLRAVFPSGGPEAAARLAGTRMGGATPDWATLPPSNSRSSLPARATPALPYQDLIMTDLHWSSNLRDSEHAYCIQDENILDPIHSTYARDEVAEIVGLMGRGGSQPRRAMQPTDGYF